jgi:chitinase
LKEQITAMKTMYWVLVLCSLLSIAKSSVRAQDRVIGYYPMWTRATLPASEVKYGLLTHINHAFAWPNVDGSISPGETTVDTALINTTHRAGRKILLSFGGAGTTQTANFAIVAADSSLRSIFANNVVSHLATYGYDGADMDWEGPSSVADRANEVALMQQLRTAFHAADTTLLITMAVGASDWSGQWRDYVALGLYVDWFNAMAYDYHGSWSKIAGHNAPLFAGTDPLTDPDYYSVDQTVQYLCTTRAIPKGKLVLGLPFFGKSFGTSTLYTQYTGEQELAYRDVVSTVQSGSWVYNWDNGSKAPYFTSESPATLISFDDSTSIAMKCQYARTSGWSGVMIWELSQDVIGMNQPLLDVVGAQMTTTTGVVAGQTDDRPTSYALSDNYPNPFNPSTTIQFAVPAAGYVSIRVFDLLGREVATLVDEYRNAGAGIVRFDASRYNVTSGVYFYRIQAGAFAQTKKMTLVK